MSAEVDTLPSNGDMDDNLTPEGLNGGGSDEDADLFGDDDDDEVQREDKELNRKLDDSELDSGDDQGRTDRIEPTIEDDHDPEDEEKQVRMLQVDLARIKPPAGDDLYFLNMPPFLGVKHKSFQPSTYEPPTAPHEARNQTKNEDGAAAALYDSNKFSAFSTASTTMFWRRDPKNHEIVQSNTRLVRWSDGSMTLQIASQPKDHYRVSTNPLRQGWPKKQAGAGGPQDYDPNKDTHNYLAAPHAVVGVDLQIVSPFDAALKIQPTGDYVDESVLKLQQSLAAAAEQHDPIASLRPTRIDPELAKREAERFEKDRIKANRKVEAAQERLITRRDRVMGRAGMGGRLGGAGLSIAGLEDEDGMPGARGNTKAKAKRRKTNRRGEIYSDDEDEDTHRGRREDEYDREDDFLAASDEEPEIYDDDGVEEDAEAEDDDPDVDDLEIEGRETVVNSRTRGEQVRSRGGGRERGSTPKRPANDDDDDDEDAIPQGSPQRGKRRRFIDDDDDDE